MKPQAGSEIAAPLSPSGAAEGTRPLLPPVLRDAARGVYRRLVLRDDRLIGVVLYGDVSHGAWLFDLLKRGA